MHLMNTSVTMRTSLFFIILAGVFVFGENDRTGKIFGSKFWNDMNKGFQNFAHDLDTYNHQLQEQLDQFTESTNRLTSRSPLVSIFPSYSNLGPSQDKTIEAIEGSFGGIDDGLKVYYEGEQTPKVIHQEKEKPTSTSTDRDESSRPGGGSTSPIFPKLPFQSVFSSILNGFFNNRRTEITIGGSYGPWWQGPNVCMDRAEIDEEEKSNKDDQISSGSSNRQKKFISFTANTYQCDVQDDKVVCLVSMNNRGIRKSLYTTYRCCHGYVKINNMCEKAEDKQMTKIIEELGATSFLELIRGSEIDDIINKENLTVFVPTNEAVEDFKEDIMMLNDPDMIKKLDSDQKEEWLSDAGEAIKSLTLPGFVQLAHYMGDKNLQTLKNESEIFIKTYFGNPPVVTANCARVVTSNQRATNGIVHTIDRINRPLPYSVVEYIRDSDQFSILNKLLKKDAANDTLHLLEENGHVTLLAPTDKAFESLPKGTLTAILDGNLCLDAILRNHILQRCVCSAVITPHSLTHNIMGGSLNLDRKDDETITIEDATVIEKDLILTNGIIHVIDKVLIPNEAKPLIEVLKTLELNKFIEYLESAKMLDEITKLSDVTIFAPSDRAFEAFERNSADLKHDREELKKLLNYHITASTLKEDDFYNNNFIDTKANHPLRVNMYTTTPLLSFSLRTQRSPKKMIGCSKINDYKVKSCGSEVHVIDEVLQIPEKSVVDALKNQEAFSIFSQILEDTGLAEELLQENDSQYTILAPSNYVFKALPQEEFDYIMSSNETKINIAKTHILTEYVCCSGINPNNWLFMDHKRTMDGATLHVRRNHQGHLKAGPARITHCGAPANNGIVHTVNQVINDINPQLRSNVDTSFLNSQRKQVFSTPGLEIYFGF